MIQKFIDLVKIARSSGSKEIRVQTSDAEALIIEITQRLLKQKQEPIEIKTKSKW